MTVARMVCLNKPASHRIFIQSRDSIDCIGLTNIKLEDYSC